MMDEATKRPWWWPELTDEQWLAGIRQEYPTATAGRSDDWLRGEYADYRKYALTWDHTGDAYEQFEALADAFLAQRATLDQAREALRVAIDYYRAYGTGKFNPYAVEQKLENALAAMEGR